MRGEEAAINDAQVGDDEIAGIHAVDDGSIELRFGENFGGLHAFARRAFLDAGYAFAKCFVVGEGEAG